MKIVHVIIGLTMGGAELMLKRLIESHLTDAVITHEVVSLTDLGVLGPELEKQGIVVHGLGMTSIIKGPITFYKLRCLLKEIRPDVVHTWMYHSDLLGGLAAYSLGIKNILWSIRSTDITKGGSKVTVGIRKLCSLLSSIVPKKIICAANSSKAVHSNIGYHNEKMQVIPNGFNVNCFTGNSKLARELRSSLEVKGSDTVFISVGRYSSVKDHKMFVQSAILLLNQNRTAKFFLIGRGLTSSNSELMPIIQGSGYSSHFVLLGERSDIPVCLEASDVFCLHSLTEGFPNVLGEAMAASLPCVTTNVGDASWLLNQPEYVVKAGDSVLLSEAMLKLVNMHDSERKKLGSINRKRIEGEFTMGVVSQQYMDLYLGMNEL